MEQWGVPKHNFYLMLFHKNMHSGITLHKSNIELMLSSDDMVEILKRDLTQLHYSSTDALKSYRQDFIDFTSCT